MIDIKNLTIEKTHEALVQGDFTVRQLCEACLSNIKNDNERLNIFREVFDDVLEQADSAQKRFVDGTATLLTGIPIAVKDNILISGKKVGACSKILENYVAIYDATVIAKLKKVGAIFIGRTNMDEFAMGSSTENSAYGTTKNPIDETRVPGGTSGGSAAAVAGGMVIAALGSDTGGSIRQPAAFCGVIGMKPTYDTVSRYGLIADTSSFDQIGPITKTIRDAEILLEAISGKDSMDATSRDLKSQISNLKSQNAKYKIGIPRSFLGGEGIDQELLQNFNDTIEKIRSAGHEIVDIEIPLLSNSLAVYYILQFAEVSSNLTRLDGIRYGLRVPGKTTTDVYMKTRGQGFGREARRRILLGTYVLSHGYYDAYYRKASNLRREIGKNFDTAFDVQAGGVDIILTPTTPTPAFKIGEKTKDPVSMYLEDIFTVPLNIAEIPGISMPCGKNNIGLPFGLQLIGGKGSDTMLIEAGKEFERVLQ